MKTKKKDFVEIDFIGRDEDGRVFDTTMKETAEKEKLEAPNKEYRSIVVCIGRQDVVKGLDRHLEEKEPGQTYVFKIPPEEAFGMRMPERMKLINTKELVQKGVAPKPGMVLTLDGIVCKVKTVSGGRTVMDFNNPLAGQTVEYEIRIKRILEGAKEKADSVMNLINLKFESRLDQGVFSVRTPAELPEKLRENIRSRITDDVEEIAKVSFETDDKEQALKESVQTNNKV